MVDWATDSLLQVELNTISTSSNGLASGVSELHRSASNILNTTDSRSFKCFCSMKTIVHVYMSLQVIVLKVTNVLRHPGHPHYDVKCIIMAR